jgi:tetrahydromethanopterin S-methyltransferase subunit G
MSREDKAPYAVMATADKRRYEKEVQKMAQLEEEKETSEAKKKVDKKIEDCN